MCGAWHLSTQRGQSPPCCCITSEAPHSHGAWHVRLAERAEGACGLHCAQTRARVTRSSQLTASKAKEGPVLPCTWATQQSVISGLGPSAPGLPEGCYGCPSHQRAGDAPLSAPSCNFLNDTSQGPKGRAARGQPLQRDRLCSGIRSPGQPQLGLKPQLPSPETGLTGRCLGHRGPVTVPQCGSPGAMCTSYEHLSPSSRRWSPPVLH